MVELIRRLIYSYMYLTVVKIMLFCAYVYFVYIVFILLVGLDLLGYC